MNNDQARTIMLRGAIAHLKAMHVVEWVPDWEFHTPDNKSMLLAAREQVILDLMADLREVTKKGEWA